MEKQFKTIYLLGCAWTQVPLVFDVAYETLGVRDFRILKNIPVEKMEGLSIPDIYAYTLSEPEEWMPLEDYPFTFAVTGPRAKLAVFGHFRNKYGIDFEAFINIVHPSAYIATSALISKGIFIEPGVIVSTLAIIGDAVTLKRGVSIGHNSIIGDYSEINPGVTISGNVQVGRGCIIGTGAMIKNQVQVGDNTFIGMGSVVTGDIPAGVIAYGNPCKVIRENDGWKI